MPDVGLFTLTELVQQVDYMASRIAMPLIVDADTGFGDAINVERTVADLERAGSGGNPARRPGAAQALRPSVGQAARGVPTRCARNCGRRPRPGPTRAPSSSVGRTLGPSKGSTRPSIAPGNTSTPAPIRIFPEALTTADEFAAFAKAVDAPLVANMTEFGKSPLLGFDELADMGYRVVLYPVTLLRVAMKAVETALAILAADGSQRELLDLMQTRQELYDLLDYNTYETARPGVFSVGTRCSRAGKRANFSMAEPIYSPGLEGVIAGETAISTVGGGLQYRGYSIEDLARSATFEEVAYLLLYRRAADGRAVGSVSASAGCGGGGAAGDHRDAAKDPADGEWHGRDAQRLQPAGSLGPDRDDNSHEANLRKAERLIAQLPC